MRIHKMNRKYTVVLRTLYIVYICEFASACIVLLGFILLSENQFNKPTVISRAGICAILPLHIIKTDCSVRFSSILMVFILSSIWPG